MTETRPKCQGTTVTGDRCAADARAGRAWCAWHDPELAEQRKQWQREGGKAKSNRRRAEKELVAAAQGVGTLPAVLFRALGRVETGDLEPSVANSMATLARAIVDVQKASEVEERLASLEARAGIGRIA